MAGATGSILLEPASLYVTTTQLAEARFHWALIATDTNCSAVRHHWHEKADTPGSAEGYGFQRVQPKSLTGRVIMGRNKHGRNANPLAAFTGSFPTELERTIFELAASEFLDPKIIILTLSSSHLVCGVLKSPLDDIRYTHSPQD